MYGKIVFARPSLTMRKRTLVKVALLWSFPSITPSSYYLQLSMIIVPFLEQTLYLNTFRQRDGLRFFLSHLKKNNQLKIIYIKKGLFGVADFASPHWEGLYVAGSLKWVATARPA